MCIRSLGALLAIALTTACASAYRVSVPGWPRYQDGELAGFLHAPGEHVDSEVPEIAVQRVRGRFFSPATEWVHSSRDPVPPRPAVSVADHAGNTTTDLADIDTRMFVVELRGPGSSPTVRTVATRSGVFDFGPVPYGTYVLKTTASGVSKTTASGSATLSGWSSRVRTIIVSDSADAAAEITVW